VQRKTAEMGLKMSPSLSMWIYVLLMGTFGLIIQVSAALGEEIGWRGFLVPELAKTSSFTVRLKRDTESAQLRMYWKVCSRLR
jgi:hypothetical protein